MSIIKRFFDSGIAETGGAPNIAALMAQHGVKNDTDSPVATPIEIEAKTEPKPEEKVVTPAETATELQTPETAKVEPQTSQQEATPVQEPQKAAEAGTKSQKFRKDRTIYRCRNCKNEFQLKPTPHTARLVKCTKKECKSTDIEIVRS